MEEERRLRAPVWKLWGPYVGERQWGTIREDYSRDGDAWEYFSREAATYRAYRWGEDVKEVYYYLDAAPTHSYLKMLYKYPQRPFPHARLLEENHRRGRLEPEFELFDTDAFDEDRYFDVFVEYAKAAPEDILMRVTVQNRGPESARLHVLPQLWFRNTWSWGYSSATPVLRVLEDGSIAAHHVQLDDYRLFPEGSPDLLFCDNETNVRRLYGQQDARGYFKDALHECIVHGNHEAVNPGLTGTKAAAHYAFEAPAGGERDVRLRLARNSNSPPFADFDAVFESRRREADEFYRHLQQGIADDDERRVQRQAFAGIIWSEQFYFYDVPQWLRGDPAYPPPPAERARGRNCEWTHLNNADIISMPDKWEYPCAGIQHEMAVHDIPEGA